MADKPKLIVLDGLDGCGKSTQFALLGKALQAAGIPCRMISFPDYDQPSAALVKLYLSGAFSSSAEDVNAYAASSFYAVDRYASYQLQWKEDYQAGTLILASRYVSSNAIHQMPKLPPSEWDSYLHWLDTYEYERLQLPRPDGVWFLDMPVAVSQSLLLERYQGDGSKKDIHEADVAYLELCREASRYAADRMGWHVISCAEGEQPRSIASIQEQLFRDVWKLLAR